MNEREGNASVVASLYATWNEHGPDAFVAALHPEIAWRGIDVDGQQRTFHGRDEVSGLLERLRTSFGAARIAPEDFIEVGAEVVVPIRLYPVDSGDDAEPISQLDLTEVWTLRDGELVGYRAYLDRDSALASARRRAG